MRTLIISITILFCTLTSTAWDEVTHAYMTQMIPELVKDPELKTLLQHNISEFTYGCWYTDIYQYTNNKIERISALNPHRLAMHNAAFVPYLQNPAVQKQANYQKLLALYLGSLAHIAEDLWYDNNLNPYQKLKTDRMKGDSKHGAFVAKQFGYTSIKVKRYLPYKELFKIYDEAGQLTPKIDTPEKFELLMDRWSRNQYKKLTALKFLNFIGGNLFFNSSPWTAANLKDAPGGMLNAAEVAAKMVENAWLRINGKQVPLIIHAQYMWPVGSMSFMLSNPDAGKMLNHYSWNVFDNKGDTIRGNLHSKLGNNMVGIFKPLETFNEGEQYTLVFRNDSDNKILAFPFTPRFDQKMDLRMAEKKPWYKTMGLGLFGFIPLFALSLMFFGIGGIIRFRWSAKQRDKKMPTRLIIAKIFFRTIGIIAFAGAIYVFVNKGWIIVETVL